MTTKPLNLLIVSSWYPSPEQPTYGSFVEEQAKLLVNAGHKVTVIHPYLMGSFFQSLGKSTPTVITKDSEILTVRIGVSPVLPGFRTLAYYRCFKGVLRACHEADIRLNSFDIIHTHAPFMGGIVGIKLALRFQIPLVHTEHTSGLIFNLSQYTKKDLAKVKRLYQDAKKVLFVSHFAADRILKTLNLVGKINADVVFNMVHESFFNETVRQGNEAREFTMIGNFIPRKNHALLFDVWPTFLEEFPNAKLTLIGEGDGKAFWQKFVTNAGISGVQFLPNQNRENMVLIMAESDVVLSTSQIETFGLTIAEAQALGIPVLVTTSGGVEEIVTSDSGVITEGTRAAFLSGLKKIALNYDTFDKQGIRIHAKQQFSSSTLLMRLEALYQEVLGRN
jgi:glycosyltransferase involved in cell wall biosynthesis